MTQRTLWPHQARVLEEINTQAAAGTKAMVVSSATGTGKSEVMFQLLRQAAKDHRRAITYCNRRLLFDQLGRGLYDSGISYGVRAAGHRPHLSRDIQLAMIQTERSRVLKDAERELHEAQLVLVDEAHLMANGAAMTIIKRHKEAGATVIGFSATPNDVGHLYDAMIDGATTPEGRQCGALLPAMCYAPDMPDRRFIKRMKTGEEVIDGELQNRWVSFIFGRVVEHWQRYNPERRPTILFAPGVDESKWFAQQFERAGVRAAHIDAKGVWVDGQWHEGYEIRGEVLDRVSSGDLEIICNRFCLDESTEILTAQGWIGIDDMTPEHDVANWDGGSIFFKKPRTIIRRQRFPGEKMVVLETPRRSIRVTEHHQMLYRTTLNGRFLKCTAGELVERSVAIPVCGNADPLPVVLPAWQPPTNIRRRIAANSYVLRTKGLSHAQSKAEAKRRIEEHALLRHTAPSDLTDAECEFIGFWIGDGNRSAQKCKGMEYRLWQGTDCPAIIARIDALITELGVDSIKRVIVTDRGTKVIQWSLPRGTGFGSLKRRGLFHLEPYLVKHGSDLLWALDQRQFDAFLRGWWMADGMPHNDRTELPQQRLMLCGSSKRRALFDRVQAIAVCRGYRASVRTYRQPDGKHWLCILSLTKQDAHRLTKYPFKFEDGWTDERVWCVESDSGNIVTRRNGSVTVMGNCLREGIDRPELYHVILATKFGSETTYVQAVGRGLRNHKSLPGHVIVQDHGANFWFHGSPNLARHWELGDSGDRREYVHLQNMREDRIREPWRCPQCAGVRHGSGTCPYCGYQIAQATRCVVQLDGRLIEMNGKMFKPHRKATPDAMKLWLRTYWSHYKKGKTFRQAFAAFSYKHEKDFGYFAYPQLDWPGMPRQLWDHCERVSDVPFSALHKEPAHVHR